MICNIISGIIANISFAILVSIVSSISWIIYHLIGRQNLLKFFNISKNKEIFIYLSNIRVIPKGSIGADGEQKSFSGSTISFKEFIAMNKFRDNLNKLIPSLSDKQNFISKLLFSDVKINVSPSYDNLKINNTNTVISLGSPVYNLTSKEMENHEKSRVKFIENNKEISVRNKSGEDKIIKDTGCGFIQRIVEEKRNLFYIAGKEEIVTSNSAKYLAENWKKLYKEFSHDKSFYVLLQFDDYGNSSEIESQKWE